MTREELIMKVALKMDEISSSADVTVEVTAGDNNPLYTQINGLLNESVNDVLMKAPAYRLNDMATLLTYNKDSEQMTMDKIGKRTIAVIDTPDDFLRFIAITDAAFQRPITALAMFGDETAMKQYNKHLIAKNSKPVAVISNDEGSGRITCYSYGESDNPSPNLYYIKRFNADTTDIYAEVSLNEYLTDIISWVCAGKVFAAQGDITKGKTCDENALALMV